MNPKRLKERLKWTMGGQPGKKKGWVVYIVACIHRIQSASPSLSHSYVWEGHVDRLPPASPPLCVCVCVCMWLAQGISPLNCSPGEEFFEGETVMLYTLFSQPTHTMVLVPLSILSFFFFSFFCPSKYFVWFGMKITRENFWWNIYFFPFKYIETKFPPHLTCVCLLGSRAPNR